MSALEIISIFCDSLFNLNYALRGFKSAESPTKSEIARKAAQKLIFFVKLLYVYTYKDEDSFSVGFCTFTFSEYVLRSILYS